MKVILQRVRSARVRVDGKEVGQINRGLLVFVAIRTGDCSKDVDYLVQKIQELRIFDDASGKMNHSITDITGELLVISQFTLYADCRKGRRPSFSMAASPDVARALYEEFVRRLRLSGLMVSTGQFQSMMDVELTNDGPVTLIVESSDA
jgi:D-tyrosyl-tRNA(Tyr) deacylase